MIGIIHLVLEDMAYGILGGFEAVITAATFLLRMSARVKSAKRRGSVQYAAF
jgi:hypothetical protein